MAVPHLPPPSLIERLRNRAKRCQANAHFHLGIFACAIIGLVALASCVTLPETTREEPLEPTVEEEIVLPPPSLPPIQTAFSDERGRIVVNGRPFFPILLYDISTDPASLQLYREYGFNTLAITRPEEADLLLAAGFYAAVHVSAKIEKLDGVLLGIGMDSPALNWKEQLIEKTKADLEKIRSQAPNRPVMHAIGYWLNEPAGVVANELPPKEKYEDLVRAMDVAAPYLYPVPYQPVRSVGEAVERANTASGGRKPLLPVLQLFTWEAKDRYPTPAELKCMVYLSLIHGADGIGYYSYNYVAGKQKTNIAAEQPELWGCVKEINAEASVIGAFLADAQEDASVTLPEGAPDVEYRAWSGQVGGLILLANTANAPKSVTLRLGTQRGPLIRLDGGKEVIVAGDQAKLELASFEAIGLRY